MYFNLSNGFNTCTSQKYRFLLFFVRSASQIGGCIDLHIDLQQIELINERDPLISFSLLKGLVVISSASGTLVKMRLSYR